LTRDTVEKCRNSGPGSAPGSSADGANVSVQIARNLRTHDAHWRYRDMPDASVPLQTALESIRSKARETMRTIPTIDNPTRAFENAPQRARNVFID